MRDDHATAWGFCGTNAREMNRARRDQRAADDRFETTDAAMERAERAETTRRTDDEDAGAYIHCRTCDQFAWTPDASAPYEGAECARCQEKGR